MNDLPGLNDPYKRTRRAFKWIFGGAAVLLWFLALRLPAYSDGTPGVACLLAGWTMIFSGETFAFLAWFSNLLFLPTLIMIFFAERKKVFVAAAMLCGLSVLLSLGAFTVVSIEGELASDPPHIVHATSGTFVWIMSQLLALVAAMLCMGKVKSQNT